MSTDPELTGIREFPSRKAYGQCIELTEWVTCVMTLGLGQEFLRVHEYLRGMVETGGRAGWVLVSLEVSALDEANGIYNEAIVFASINAGDLNEVAWVSTQHRLALRSGPAGSTVITASDLDIVLGWAALNGWTPYTGRL